MMHGHAMILLSAPRLPANRHLACWADIDSSLWNCAFSGMSKAGAYCSICLDTTHSTSGCPLYPQEPALRRNTTPAEPFQLSGADPHTQSTRSICLNWNRGKCRFPTAAEPISARPKVAEETIGSMSAQNVATLPESHRPPLTSSHVLPHHISHTPHPTHTPNSTHPTSHFTHLAPHPTHNHRRRNQWG